MLAALPPNEPNPAAVDALLCPDPQIPACAFSFSRSLIDFPNPDNEAGDFAPDDALLAEPSDIDHRSSKFALAAGFGGGDVAEVRVGLSDD